MYKKIVVVNPKTGSYFMAADIEAAIVRKYPEIRKHPEFKSFTDRLFDATNACTREEQQRWMKQYMLDTFNHACFLESWDGDSVINQPLKMLSAAMFVAAHDLYVL